MALKEERFKHPSYGVISIGRFSSSGTTLFDSPFRHHHGIHLTISKAYKSRSLNRDLIMSDEDLIRVSMSEVQFANMITSANVGCGTPCTIDRLDGKMIEPPPQENVRATFQKEVKESFKDLAKASEELEMLLDKKDAKAVDRHRMKALAGQIAMAFRSNLVFMQQQFEEQIEKAVSAARAEIQAHADDIVKRTGLKAIEQGQFNLEMK